MKTAQLKKIAVVGLCLGVPAVAATPVAAAAFLAAAATGWGLVEAIGRGLRGPQEKAATEAVAALPAPEPDAVSPASPKRVAFGASDHGKRRLRLRSRSPSMRLASRGTASLMAAINARFAK